MAGNSRRKGAVRKQGTKKGQTVGSGGQRRKGLQGKGPTPPAEMRYGHPAQRKANAKAAQAKDSGKGSGKTDGPEIIAGRNPVVEALRAEVPATALYVALNLDNDDRVAEAVQLCADRGVSVLEIPRQELDQKTQGALHQGVGLQVPPFSYSEPADRLTAVAWRSSAGTAARLPVAVATNLTRQLRAYADEGLMLVGLDADAETPLDELNLATEPLVVVVGSEGRGLSRLVRETCDTTTS